MTMISDPLCTGQNGTAHITQDTVILYSNVTTFYYNPWNKNNFGKKRHILCIDTQTQKKYIHTLEISTATIEKLLVQRVLKMYRL